MHIFKIIAASFLLSLFLTGCNLDTASGELHGRWITTLGESIEFTGGRFTRTIPGEGVRSGTFETNGGEITFHRRGYSSFTYSFSLNFPVLTIGEIEYFHNSPRAPDQLSGMWFGFISEHSTAWPGTSFYLSTGTPLRGSPMVLEGNFRFPGRVSGEYEIRSNHITAPSLRRGNFTETVTRISGMNVHSFITNFIPDHLRIFFDVEAVRTPEDLESWWFDIYEVRRLFLDAAQRAGNNLALEQQIRNLMNLYLGGVASPQVFDYTIEIVDGTIWDLWGEEVQGNAILTLRIGGRILTFANSGSASLSMLNHHALGMLANGMTCNHSPIAGSFLMCCQPLDMGLGGE